MIENVYQIEGGWVRSTTKKKNTFLLFDCFGGSQDCSVRIG